MPNWILYAGLAVVVVMFFAALAILGIVVIVKLFGGKGKAKTIVAAPATLIASDSNMFSALSGGGPEATAIVKDAHLRFGLKRNLREHYEATKHLMDDPQPVAPPVAPPVPNPPPAP